MNLQLEIARFDRMRRVARIRRDLIGLSHTGVDYTLSGPGVLKSYSERDDDLERSGATEDEAAKILAVEFPFTQQFFALEVAKKLPRQQMAYVTQTI